MIKKILQIVLIIILILLIIVLIAYLFLTFYPGVGKLPNKEMRKQYKEKTNLFYDSKFHNEKNISLMTSEKHSTKGDVIKPDKTISVNKWDSFIETDGFYITWLGHSSSLIQMNRQNILIDLVLTKYASPVSFTGSKRFSDIAIEPEIVKNIDVLLISHDHYDHLDYFTIKKIDKEVKNYIVPLGVESFLIGWGIDKNKIHSLSWWESITINDITYTATPAQHYSGRNILKKDATWWCGFYINNNENTVYYTGDTGYTDSFKEISTKLGEVDVLLADSGQYNMAWSEIHMNPIESLQTAKDVLAKYFIPVHWGAFALSNHNWFEPAKITTDNQDKYNVKVITPKIGERVNYENIENYTIKWWEKL